MKKVKPKTKKPTFKVGDILNNSVYNFEVLKVGRIYYYCQNLNTLVSFREHFHTTEGNCHLDKEHMKRKQFNDEMQDILDEKN